MEARQFGKYLLFDRISTGGMAEVYLAKSIGVRGFEKVLAIKRILPLVAEDPDFQNMFIDEAQISARLNHANIGQVFEFGQEEEEYFIAMEYISGQDVRRIRMRLAETERFLPIAMALHICSRLCQALDYAHRQKNADGASLEIVHRDVSPPNVLVSYEGEVKLIDFGIARAASRLTRTRAGKLKGKFAYLSPEQVAGLQIDHRSDIFSSGTLLYEMLTHQRPFSGDNQMMVLDAIRKGETAPPSTINPDVPLEVDRIVMKALARDREERYGWPSELRADIERHLARTGTVFETYHLADWMREEFKGEIESERLLLTRLQQLRAEDCPVKAAPLTDEVETEVRFGAGSSGTRGEDTGEEDRPPAEALMPPAAVGDWETGPDEPTMMGHEEEEDGPTATSWPTHRSAEHEHDRGAVPPEQELEELQAAPTEIHQMDAPDEEPTFETDSVDPRAETVAEVHDHDDSLAPADYSDPSRGDRSDYVPDGMTGPSPPPHLAQPDLVDAPPEGYQDTMQPGDLEEDPGAPTRVDAAPPAGPFDGAVGSALAAPDPRQIAHQVTKETQAPVESTLQTEQASSKLRALLARLSSVQIILIAAAATLVLVGVIVIVALSVGGDGDPQPQGTAGTLMVTTSKPAACTIHINGEPKGLLAPGGSMTLNDLRVGKHLVSVRCVGFRPYAGSATVKPGQVTLLDAQVQKE